MNWIKAVKVVDAIILFSSLMKEYQAWPRSGIPRVKVKFSRRLQPIQGWLCDDLTFRIRQFVCWSGRGINGSRVLVMVLFTDRWSSSYWYFMTMVMTLCTAHGGCTMRRTNDDFSMTGRIFLTNWLQGASYHPRRWGVIIAVMSIKRVIGCTSWYFLRKNM